MNHLSSLDVKFIKGIGPKKAELLTAELGISSAADLLRNYPNHYIDRSKCYTVSDLVGEMPYAQIRGRFVTMNVVGEGAKTRLTALFSDGKRSMEVVWFRKIKNIRESIRLGQEYILFGKPTRYGPIWQMAHPEIDVPNTAGAREGFRGIYPLTERLRSRGFTSRNFYVWVQNALEGRSITDPMPASVVMSRSLMPLDKAIRQIHMPESPELLEKAKYRLKFDELFYIQLDIVKNSRVRHQSTQGFRFRRIAEWFNNFYNQCLPFPLTDAQKRVVKEIRADVNTGRQMNRLVQGDVGSGKTIVALMAMLMAIDNGYQACLMAPTEILATQHFETLNAMTAKIGLNIELLTGSTKAARRRAIHESLRDGSLHILVGTHALIEDNVTFANLGLAVIDEQHRFGVAQRAKLWRKNICPPHILVMTATPIPRTLAMTVYGDLDVSVIDELPPGRKPVTTLLRYDNQRNGTYKAVYNQLRQGRQAYIVYPLIDENEKLDLRSLQEGYEIIRQTFPDYNVAMVHGRMKPDEKDHQMQLFISGQARILVATTVIEVGVNVPNASVMIIENAERFGLSQLHQLRGRVGRGADQSYCVLMTKYQIAAETRKRLEVMTSTTDGFVIAEADMKFRGPGDIEGTMQSGMPFDLHIASLATDGAIMQQARQAAESVLDSDPELTSPAHRDMKRYMQSLTRRTADWSNIS
ncbi:MAG: ATP-dependent DNA helicase RecG [Muribaculaceae bacterium]|nr:ATP-dependent DNA helicase RecG [Muribaculaceae bacterium]